MILVTLGTNDKSFVRLLETIDKAIKEGVIQDEVIVQSGFTDYQSDSMKVFKYLDRDQFSDYLSKADLVITHGGVGTIMTALKNNRKILAAARLHQYKEHVNDHQIEILEAFDQKGYLIYMQDLSKFQQYYERVQTFTPKKFESNTDNMIRLIESWMDEEESKR